MDSKLLLVVLGAALALTAVTGQHVSSADIAECEAECDSNNPEYVLRWYSEVQKKPEFKAAYAEDEAFMENACARFKHMTPRPKVWQGCKIGYAGTYEHLNRGADTYNEVCKLGCRDRLDVNHRELQDGVNAICARRDHNACRAGVAAALERHGGGAKASYTRKMKEAVARQEAAQREAEAKKKAYMEAAARRYAEEEAASAAATRSAEEVEAERLQREATAEAERKFAEEQAALQAKHAAEQAAAAAELSRLRGAEAAAAAAATGEEEAVEAETAEV